MAKKLNVLWMSLGVVALVIAAGGMDVADISNTVIDLLNYIASF
jgi:hypothetical protein